MPDLVIGGRHRPYTLVTTAVRRGPTGQTRSAQVDIHLTSGDIRLRFADPACLRIFSEAFEILHYDLTTNPQLVDRDVQTRVYSDATDPNDI